MKNMKKFMAAMVFTSMIVGAIPAQKVEAVPTEEQSYSMEVTGEIKQQVNSLDVVIPLRVSVGLDTTVEDYDKMFTSPDIKITNNTTGGDIKLIYETGTVKVGERATKMVPPTNFQDWTKITSLDSESFFALGVKEVEGWEAISPITKEDVWFISNNINIGTIPKAASVGAPSEASFQLTAKHGIKFVRAFDLKMDLYFKVELQPE